MATPSDLRQALADLNVLAARDLGGLFRSLREGDSAEEALRDILPGLIDRYGIAASALAADWYDDFRESLGVGGRFVAIPADIEDTGAHALIGWALDEATDDGSLVALLEGGMQRRVLNFGRFTITDSAIEDPSADGWQRLGVGANCPFCSMLISRGAVYSESTVTFASHDHCNCVAVPAFKGKPRPVRLDAEGRRLDVSKRRDRTESDQREASNKRIREWIDSHPNVGCPTDHPAETEGPTRNGSIMSEQQSAEATETEANATEQNADAVTLPDDHPLVRTLAAQKETIRELKAKAQRLDEIEESQKSEAEKAADRIRQLEAEAESARREALRFKVASKFGVSDEDADLFLTGSDEETLTKQAERLAARTTAPQKGPYVSREGATPQPKVDERAAFADFLTGRHPG